VVAPAIDFLLGLGVGLCLFWWGYLHFQAENASIRRNAARRISEAEKELAEAQHALTVKQVEASVLREMLHNERARITPHPPRTGTP
jgi:hypothetical protein